MFEQPLEELVKWFPDPSPPSKLGQPIHQFLSCVSRPQEFLCLYYI